MFVLSQCIPCSPARRFSTTLFPHVLSASSMKKYPDKTTFDERSLFSVLTVFTTKLHCTMNNNFKRDLQLTECEQRMVRIGNNDLNNRRLIEYAKYSVLQHTRWMACCNWTLLFIYGKFANRSLSISRPLFMNLPLIFLSVRKPRSRGYHLQNPNPLLSNHCCRQFILFSELLVC